MRVARLHGREDLRLHDEDKPRPAAGEVLVRVGAVGLCGSDIHWFAENMFLPTLPRVRQEGLARPGRDGLLVLAASEGMTKGIALLDTPDIDSVVRAHDDFA